MATVATVTWTIPFDGMRKQSSNSEKRSTNRRKKMKQDRRVLVRLGARQLTAEEVEYVSGSSNFPHTNACSFISPVATSTGDGDGCPMDLSH
jgi:hypothetical protein